MPAAAASSRVRERKWMLLATDGRHSWMGRHSDPSEDEIAAAESALNKQGLSGWLTILEGDYWARRGKLTVLMVRPLAEPNVPFEAAVASFHSARKNTLEGIAPSGGGEG